MKKKIKIISVFLLAFIINVNLVSAAGFSNNGVTTACGIELPEKLPTFTSGIYNIVKLLVPVILIIMGMIDFTKAVMASDEKKMSDAKSTFIRRLIAAVIVFMIMAVVQFIFKQIDSGYQNSMANCVNCLLSNDKNACGDSGYVECESFTESECDSEHAKKLGCAKVNGKCGRDCGTMNKDECLANSDRCKLVGQLCYPK